MAGQEGRGPGVSRASLKWARAGADQGKGAPITGGGVVRMEAWQVARILWSSPGARPGGLPGGSHRLEIELRPERTHERIENARTSGDPFAVCFADLGDPGLDRAGVGDLFRLDPDIFVVLEGDAGTLPEPGELGAWAPPDRCLTLARPVRPRIRAALAEHLCARWLREEAERHRVALLEAEARRDRLHRRDHEKRLQILYGIVERLHGTESLDAALGVALGEMGRFLGAKTGSLLLLDGPSRFRVVEAVGPHRDRIRGIEVPLEESRVARYALEESRPILVSDVHENGRFEDDPVGIRYRPRSILSVPLFAQGEPLGVLNFGGDRRDVTFSDHDRKLVVTLGRQVAVALEKARLLEGLRRTVAESIRALAGAIEAKDPYTRGHSDRVTHYSRLIAQAMGLGARDLDIIVRAAVLHDVGKIGVPSAVLNKPSRLDQGEFRLIQRHPQVGVEIVREIQAMEGTLAIIQDHHERIDGKGYPRGLRGDEIALGARILAVADTFDAMTSDRPYRKGLPTEVAFDEIKRCSGTQFDPEVAQVFLEGAPGWPDLDPADEGPEPLARAG